MVTTPLIQAQRRSELAGKVESKSTTPKPRGTLNEMSKTKVAEVKIDRKLSIDPKPGLHKP